MAGQTVNEAVFGRQLRPEATIFVWQAAEMLARDKTNRLVVRMLVELPFGRIPMGWCVLYDALAPTFESTLAAQNKAASEGNAVDLRGGSPRARPGWATRRRTRRETAAPVLGLDTQPGGIGLSLFKPKCWNVGPRVSRSGQRFRGVLKEFRHKRGERPAETNARHGARDHQNISLYVCFA